ncbi:MAG: hypothetical protein QOG63_353 [Thermoleophilaceae bacterium]|nr:hypothetical protein [Thermoleophilaceae bacterium]
MRLWPVAAAATAAILVALVVVLSHSSHHGTGTNGANMNALKPLPAGTTLCQPAERLEAGTGRVRFRPVEGAPAGPFELRILPPGGGRPLATGSVPEHTYSKGEFAFARVGIQRSPVQGATVCVRNAGSADSQLYGLLVGRGDAAQYEPGALLPEPWVRIRLDYSEAGERTWWSIAPDVAERFGLFKASFLGSWTMWVVLAAALGLALGTTWYAARAFAR